MGRIADTFIRHVSLLFALTIAGSIGAAVYLATDGIRYDYNVETFLPAEERVIEDFRLFSEHFPRDDAVVIVGFESDSLFSPVVLSDIRDMTAGFERIPTVESVASMTNHRTIRLADGSVELARTVSHFGSDPALRSAQRTEILSDTTAVGYLVSRDARTTAFYVRMAVEDGLYPERQAVIDGIKAVTARYEPRYQFRYSGIPVIRNVYVDSIVDETSLYVLLSSLVILVVLVWLFRSVRGVVIPVAIVYLGMTCSIAFVMLGGGSIDVLSSTIAAIVLVVGVADSVHLLSRYNDSISRGLSTESAVSDMVVRLGSATFLTSVTTAIGFATLTTSSIIPVRRFGGFTAVGVLATFVVSVIVLGAVLRWLPRPRPRATAASEWFTAILGRLDVFCARRWRGILVVCAVAVVVGLAGASQLRVNSFVNDDLGPGSPLYRDMVFLQERMVSPFSLDIMIDAGTADAFTDPGALTAVRSVQAYLDAEGPVGRTHSIIDLLDRTHSVLDSSATVSLPDNPDQIAQYLLLLELVDPEVKRQLLSTDHSKLRIAALVDDVGTAEFNPMLARVDSVVDRHLSTVGETTVTGTVVLVSKVSELIVESLLFSIGLAFVFVSLIMALVYRSLPMILISLIPNVFPLIAVAAVMGVAGIDVKPATAVVFSISFGIAVDDTIHFLARLRQELKLGSDLRASIRLSLMGTGKAIALTSLILVAGFAVLTTSQFQSSVYMGALISLAVAAALVADLIVLPALLHGWGHLTGMVHQRAVGKK